LLPDEVCHFAPYRDPHASFRGMSWLTPVIREIMGDKAATEHKLKFFENGATPNLVVKAHPDIKDDVEFDAYVKRLRERNEGLENAYKTMILGGGADVVSVGADLQQLEFKATQGAGETRICAAARVHPVIVGLSEGLQGSSLNAGNFTAARRIFADGTMRPLWRNFAGSISRIIRVPSDSELWYDARDVAFLQDDQADRAKVQQVQSQAMKTLVDGGWEPDSIVASVMSDDFSLLKHSGLPTVQVQSNGKSPTAELESVLET
jgi:phage portal protein BeeE